MDKCKEKILADCIKCWYQCGIESCNGCDLVDLAVIL